VKKQGSKWPTIRSRKDQHIEALEAARDRSYYSQWLSEAEAHEETRRRIADLEEKGDALRKECLDQIAAKARVVNILVLRDQQLVEERSRLSSVMRALAASQTCVVFRHRKMPVCLVYDYGMQQWSVTHGKGKVWFQEPRLALDAAGKGGAG